LQQYHDVEVDSIFFVLLMLLLVGVPAICRKKVHLDFAATRFMLVFKVFLKRVKIDKIYING
jgi:hypothetical protein